MYFFKDLRGFTCLAIVCAISGVSYVAPSIIWPTRKNLHIEVVWKRLTNWLQRLLRYMAPIQQIGNKTLGCQQQLLLALSVASISGGP
jgi:hypothetical protein